MPLFFLRNLTCVVAMLFSVHAFAESPPVESVGKIELSRYAGKWYEIAAFPMFFQRQCTGDTTAEYVIRQNGEKALKYTPQTALTESPR